MVYNRCNEISMNLNLHEEGELSIETKRAPSCLNLFAIFPSFTSVNIILIFDIKVFETSKESTFELIDDEYSISEDKISLDNFVEEIWPYIAGETIKIVKI